MFRRPLSLASLPILSLLLACASHVPAPVVSPVTQVPPVASSGPPIPAAPAPVAATAAPAALPPSPPAPRPPVPVPVSAFASTKTDPAWATCLRARKPVSKAPAADLTATGAACASVSHMKPEGPPVVGKQADRDPVQSFPLEARAGRCYRAFAQAGEGILDLHVVVRDSAGIEVARDDADRAGPVAPEDGAVCFQKDDHASIVVSVGMGSGVFAVQVWQD
jgi:hypothetical protein